ncbi:lipid A-modifier LpxR family protein [Sulfitobacter sp. CW3]|uniref:lipid A-modifier LpxR family protein n=1 Tax=Sulfitobacter sp. CW3 TaxID=2861965 RepID=UPI001C5D69FE|nr:lipid A-modifier LpxR family protein [Sulfitobacter sp. CW3]MBW4961307.1 lipid A deacylase LpxR family protein [Sulfitobacter sp. CW3]
MLKAIAAAIFLFSLPQAGAAEGREYLGYGRLITNDYLGDLQDRERTGAVSSSRVWGPEWTGALPKEFGELVELRLGIEVLAPANLTRPSAGSRPWAGAVSAGIHTHFKPKGIEYTVGASLYVTGPQTGLGSLQRELHELIGDPPPTDSTLDNQIENGFHPTVLVEVARTIPLGENIGFRPFVEGQAGIETMMRAGFDVTFGSAARDAFLVRDSTSGHRYRVIQNAKSAGYSFVAGADVAYVSDSTFLPENRGYMLTDHRDRVRLGVHWQGKKTSIFYGATWLGKEYETQPDDQVVGSLRINFSF